jgi:hypothetical protein
MRFMGAEGCPSGLVYGRLPHHPHNLQAHPSPARSSALSELEPPWPRLAMIQLDLHEAC